MRILFLSGFYPYPPDNGARIRAFNLLKELARLGHSLHVLSFTPSRQVEGLEHLRDFCAEVLVVPHDPSKHRVSSLRSYLSFTPRGVLDSYSPEMATLVTKLLNCYSFGVIVADTRWTAPYVADISHVPKVLSEQNNLTRWHFEEYQRETRPVHRLWKQGRWWKCRRYEASLFPRFDLCAFVSEQDARTAREVAPDILTGIVPNGVDVEYYKPAAVAPRPNTLVYTGSLTYTANYDAVHFFLSDIWPSVKSALPTASLAVTGRVDAASVSSLPLGVGVVLTGHLEDIRPTLAKAWACVVPLRRGGGTRLKILEAMALGTPVIATSKGAEGLDVTPDVNILIADDPTAFANQTVRLLRDSELRQYLEVNGRRLVEEKYSWHSIGEHFSQLLTEVVDGRRQVSASSTDRPEES